MNVREHQVALHSGELPSSRGARTPHPVWPSRITAPAYSVQAPTYDAHDVSKLQLSGLQQARFWGQETCLPRGRRDCEVHESSCQLFVILQTVRGRAWITGNVGLLDTVRNLQAKYVGPVLHVLSK